MPKVSKAINEIYKQFHSMFPVYVLDITLPTGRSTKITNSLEIYDVNVTPDKKTLFFENEVEIVNFVRVRLIYWHT
jgi:DNA mismatch repair ATPase MutL